MTLARSGVGSDVELRFGMLWLKRMATEFDQNEDLDPDGKCQAEYGRLMHKKNNMTTDWSSSLKGYFNVCIAISAHRLIAVIAWPLTDTVFLRRSVAVLSMSLNCYVSNVSGTVIIAIVIYLSANVIWHFQCGLWCLHLSSK